MDITSESSSMKADGSRWTNKDEMNGKLSTSAIKINKNSKENADSDSSSGNSSLSSTPNQVDQSVFASYCSSSSSSSGTSSLNLCDNSDSGNSSTGNSSKSSTPDNILQKQSNGTTNGENDVQTHKNANQTQPLDNDLSDSVGHDSSSSTLLQDDDDGLDFDPISLSSRALEDMLRSTSNTNGNSNGQSVLDNFNTSSFGGSGRMIDRNLPNGFHHHQQQQQQQHLPINNSPFDALLGGESSSFLANKSNSFGNNSNNNAFGPFGSLQQQQRQTLLNQQQTSPQNAASHLQQQQILEQLQQIQHQRQQLDLQHKLSQQSDKNLFGNMEMYLSNMVQQQHQQQQQQNSAQLFQLNQQNQPNSQTKLWQQNSLRQLLPNVNIKFQQPNVDDSFLSQSLANLGLNAFGSSNGGLNNQAQSLSPSALNAAAAASFFGSNANSGQGLRPSNHHSSNSQMMGNNSQFWQSNGGPKSPPHSNGNNVLSAQQHQFIQQQHQQQQLMRIQRPQQNANFNSFFMNQFLANNMNSNPNVCSVTDEFTASLQAKVDAADEFCCALL
ncbi:hypothetical protein BLOT_015961 [Blomia tropicalis]|nr:hypothetical protein BLOT_015961 [Blomia tropicalis]